MCARQKPSYPRRSPLPPQQPDPETTETLLDLMPIVVGAVFSALIGTALVMHNLSEVYVLGVLLALIQFLWGPFREALGQ
jgi:hypothetical protein